MENNNKHTKQKGERLNWTPIEKAEKVSLKKINVSGKKIPSEVVQKSKKFVDNNKRLLIP